MKWMKKYWYYLKSLIDIMLNLRNWPLFFWLFLVKSKPGEFLVSIRKPPIRMAVRSAMDIWAVKETVVDAFYTRYGMPIQDHWRIIDIGAGIGDFCVYAAYGRPKAAIYAYEPFSESYRLLLKNLRLNAVDNVKAYQQAVWSSDVLLTLDVSSGEPLQITSNGMDRVSKHKDVITVQARSLASIMKEHNLENVNLVKLDCEGAEYEILLQTPAIVLAKIDRIIMEYHDLDSSANHQTLILFLEKAGFDVSRYDNFVHNKIGYLFACRE